MSFRLKSDCYDIRRFVLIIVFLFLKISDDMSITFVVVILNVFQFFLLVEILEEVNEEDAFNGGVEEVLTLVGFFIRVASAIREDITCT